MQDDRSGAPASRQRQTGGAGTRSILPALLCIIGITRSAAGMPTSLESPTPGVLAARADTGYWAATLSSDITHQSAPAYQARKILDLSTVPDGAWRRTRSARISAFFIVRDYSAGLGRPIDGLDEAYEVVVNGHVHRYTTASALPAWTDGIPQPFTWHDHAINAAELVHGPNEIVIRKAAGGDNDDYLYLGIDVRAKPGASSVQFDGPPWRTDALNIPGSTGEYMVRLSLVTADMSTETVLHAGTAGRLTDPHHLVAYAGSPTAAPFNGREARIEWNTGAIDPLAPLELLCAGQASTTVQWLGPRGEPIGAPIAGGRATFVPGRETTPSGVLVSSGSPLGEVTIRWSRTTRGIAKPIDMAPRMSPSVGHPTATAGRCALSLRQALLTNGTLTGRFALRPTVSLVSLRNGFTQSEMLVPATVAGLFAVTTGGRTYLGSRDFRTTTLRPVPRGFVAHLTLREPAIGAELRVTMGSEGLEMALKVTNTGTAPADLYVAFPLLEGLTAGGPGGAGDHYFYPLGGGIIAAKPALVRTTYGDHQALYQVMDLFSPERGGGLYLRVADTQGFHKILALAKGAPRGEAPLAWDRVITQTRDEYKPPGVLIPGPGVGMAVEYLRRTRIPGGSFEPSPVVLAAHAGDWHSAMATYAAWAHRVWRYRPRPSRLGDIRQMIARGWSTDLLWKGGSYRRDLVEPAQPGVGRTMTDCVELMSWWDWSPLGPWNTPIDQVTQRLSAAQAAACAPYIVTDPSTGKRMWNNQPGDYSGYNHQFGGLPAFRHSVEDQKRQGALVTLYTDPLRLDGNCPIGAQHGRQWTVVGQDGKPIGAYDVWNPCADSPAVRQWVASTVGRVLRETGADGVRLDEYGHMGWACFSKDHPHTYAEPGVSQWNKAVAETVRGVRRGMDSVSHHLVLTTEHPAYDYLMQFLDGCITYDLSVQACPLRPLECNLQRFYFPECKPFELDYSGAPISLGKKLWNAEGSFGQPYPIASYLILQQNRDAYEAGTATPLIQTSAQGIYCNRFQSAGPGPGKILYHLYNATGHTFSGGALRVHAGRGRHMVNLLDCSEVNVDATGAAPLFMPRDSVACLADLPRLLEVSSSATAIRVRLPRPAPGCVVTLCAADGSETARASATGSSALFPHLPAHRSRPACVKLLRNGILVDLACLPPRPR